MRDVDTFFYETACGSGTVAVCVCTGKNEVKVLQPSGYVITGRKLIKGNREYIRITGIVMTDNKVRTIEEELV